MSHTVEIRDHYAVGHERRASTLARFIAREMCLSQTIPDTIYVAGPVHKIDMRSIPAESGGEDYA